MPNSFALPSLRIVGYRGFREVKIERLGRANLIVGKNNVGKTSILEAIRLFAQPASLDVLFDILEARDEFTERLKDKAPVPLPVEQLFNKRGLPYVSMPRPYIGPLDNDLRSVLFWPELLDISTENFNSELRWTHHTSALGAEPAKRRVVVFQIGSLVIRYPIDDAMALSNLRRLFSSGEDERLKDIAKPTIFISSAGLSQARIADLWDRVVLTPEEDEVLASIGMINPDVTRLVNKYVEDAIQPRITFAKLRGHPTPVTMRSLGDGVNRLFGMSSAMVCAKEGFLLIDEVENGIHYSVQADLWRFLFKLAMRLDVQVFATTHSWDMVKAFQLAASESEEEGVLIRLAQKAGQTIVAEFDEHELEVAVEGQIEVR